MKTISRNFMISSALSVTLCENKRQASKIRENMRARNFHGIKMHKISHSQLKFISRAEIALIAFLMIFRRQNRGADVRHIKKWDRDKQ